MDHFGIWSLVPPVIAIVLAIKTRQVFISLLFGIWLGWIVLNNWNFLDGSIATIQALVDVFKDSGNTRTIMFSSLVGALIAYIQRSGGVDGFIKIMSNKLQKLDEGDKSRTRVQLYAWITGVIVFVESSITVLTVGSLFRPLFDRYKISREKLAYIADSTSAPICILVPFNAWGAYIIGLLLAQGISDPILVFVKAYPFNFYPILALIGVLLIILSKKDYGPMKKAEHRAQIEGKVLADAAQPMISDDVVGLQKKEGIPVRAKNMIVPIFVMVFMMPFGLLYTGWNISDNFQNYSFMEKIFDSMSNGSGSTAVLWAVLSSIFIAAIMYRTQKLFKMKELIELAFKGIGGLIPLALLMMLAFAIGKVSKDLGAGLFVAEITKEWLSPSMVPFIIFIASSFIAFSTGTSWGTFAIMISIAIPMATSMDVSIPLALAAVLGGGVFGDHCSPISDTTIISSMASASDHIDHVKTQLPYALVIGGVSSIFYIIAGFVL
ncbi:MAG: sodium:solute symporter [Calditrichaeota bacterium]|nr:MAG: sodium:solute symporter [Calditrichota bacterium]MBL1203893.1 sodium:solute symporter [Calditrichota bacterium]NOG43725.1 sodium:solute symporter [Calditrichota bacterium]